MRSDLVLAINQLCAERKISPEVVMDALHAALISAYRRNYGAAATIDVRIDPGTGDSRVYVSKQVVEEVHDPKAEILLAEAIRVEPRAEIGQTVLLESTPRDFGRIAAQTAKQVILQKIKEAERDAQYNAFADSEGEIRHGTIQSFDYNTNDVIVNLDGAEALLPVKEQVSTEHYRRNGRIRAYVLEVRKGSRGPQITLSRRSPLFLRRLLELEVPEIFSGTVEIKNIAREAGSRSKVAVHSTQEGVDPVGSCVGVRGGRIHNVVNELGGEKIDVVQWSQDIGAFVANALSPAKVMNVLLNDDSDSGRTATVIVPDRQLSLAIGKEGQNARLAAKLTGWRIDIKSATEAAEETLGRLQDRGIAPEDMDLLSLAQAILQKHEGTGITVEERQLIDKEVEQGKEADLLWPAGGQAIAETQGAAAPPPTHETQEAGVAASRPGGLDRSLGAGRMAPAAGEEEEPDDEGDLAPPVKRPFDLDSETAPPFEGEPVEDSSGWVQTASTEDPYAGWQDTIEAVPEFEDEWMREDLDTEEPAQVGAKKKKRKKSGKSRFVQGRPPGDWA